MDVKHLRLIATLAETGTLSKASEILFLSQSALSHQLKDLENRLGAPLFHRLNKRMVITPLGKMVLDSTNDVLKDLDNLQRKITEYIQGEEGTIRLSTECYTCYYWLSPLLKAFNQRFPKIQINIVMEATGYPLKYLLAGELDLAIYSGTTGNSNFQEKLLFEDELMVVVSPDHRWQKFKRLPVEQFSEETLIIYDIALEDTLFFQKVLKPAGVVPQNIVKVKLTEAIVEMVRAGLGVSIMASWAARPYVESGKLTAIPIPEKGLKRPWYAVTLNQNYLPKFLTAFVEFLVANPIA